jgi:hypothetical protein
MREKLLRGEQIMLKKNVWIAGLLMGLAIMFVGCVDAVVEDDSGVWMTVTDLQEIIKDVDPQVLNEEKWNAIFDDTPFKMCGESNGKFEIIDAGGGKKALKISQMTANWGVGFDVRSASNPSANVKGVNYKGGDKITLKGSTDLENKLTLNTKGENGIGKISNWSATGSFDTTLELTSAEASDIKANSGKGSLRVHGDSPSAAGRIGTIIMEEFKVEGKRGAGDIEPPPPVYTIAGAGDYMKPADTATEFYLDLGLTVLSQLNDPSKFPAAKIVRDKMTVKFDTNTQGVFVPFTPELKRIILSKKVQGATFAYYIDGELDNYFATDPITNQIRCGFANDGGGDWNVTDLPAINTATGFNANRSLTWSGNFTNAKTQGFIIQARQNGNNQPIPLVSGGADVSYTATIKSIKIVITGGSAPSPITALAVTLEAPRAGATAATTVTGTNFAGTVKWSPALNEGKFERTQVYSAEIAITADYGYDITATTATVNSTAASYNPGTQVVSKTFSRTQAFNELKAEEIFRLTDYIKNIDGKNIGPSLANAGGSGAEVTVESGNKIGLTQSGVTADWNGIDIVLSKIDVGIDPALYKVKVVVTGKVLEVTSDASSDGQMRISSAGSPYQNPPTGSAYENYSADNLTTDSVFTCNINEIASNYLTNGAGNQGALRICNNATGSSEPKTIKISSFIITEIVITNEGLR